MNSETQVQVHIPIKGGTITGISVLRHSLEGEYLDINFMRHQGWDIDLTWTGTERKFKREWYRDEDGKLMVREVDTEW